MSNKYISKYKKSLIAFKLWGKKCTWILGMSMSSIYLKNSHTANGDGQVKVKNNYK